MKLLFFVFSVCVLTVFCNNHRKQRAIEGQEIYVCLPCGSDCYTTQYKNSGTCGHCGMELVKKSTITHSNVEPENLCSFISKAGNENILLLDVRTQEEFEGKSKEKFGRLNHALNIPVQQLEKRISELAAYKNKQIVVYCSHSHRSPRASYMLSENGFNKVTNMLGGMSVWKVSVKDDECNQNLFISQ